VARQAQAPPLLLDPRRARRCGSGPSPLAAGSPPCCSARLLLDRAVAGSLAAPPAAVEQGGGAGRVLFPRHAQGVA